MIVAAAPAGAMPLPGRDAGGIRRDLASLLLRRSLHGAIVGAGIGLSYFAAALPLVIDAEADLLNTFASMAVRSTWQMILLTLLITLALRFARTHAQRLASVALAMLISYAFMVLLVGVPYGYFETEGFDEMRTRVHSLWNVAAVGILMATYYVYWDRTYRSQQALRAAQLEQQRAEHGVLESRLNVLRARVDPAFLFEALDAVRRLYGERSDAAERLLEDLIKYLRATLPQSREQASSMAEEMHLAATYLEVHGAISGRDLRLRADLDPMLAGAFFPPRVLMPIVEAAAGRAQAGSAGLAVRARLEGDRAHVTIEEQGCAQDYDGPVLREAAMTLRAFFGPDAQVRSHAGAAGRVVILEFLHDGRARKDAP